MPNAKDPTVQFPGFNRSQMIPLIDGNTIRQRIGWEPVGEGFSWARVDKSEVFEFATNPQTETKAYIDTANDYTYVKSYQAAMEQEIIIDPNNEVYGLMYEYTMLFPTGSDAEVPCMMIFPSVKDPAVSDAFLWKTAMLTTGAISSPDGKLTFTINFNGEMERGTGAKSAESGKFEFTPLPATPAAPEQASILSAKSSSTKSPLSK